MMRQNMIEYRVEPNLQDAQVDALNKLQEYLDIVGQFVMDHERIGTLTAEDQDMVTTLHGEGCEFLDNNREATADELNVKLQKLQAKIDPHMK